MKELFECIASMQVFILFAPFRFIVVFFFFNDTATTEIYTLSLHDALPISGIEERLVHDFAGNPLAEDLDLHRRSEEHTSELQSPCNIVCRLLLAKKKRTRMTPL